MDILIFCIGFGIFVTYMFFLLRMINRAHKHQERTQGKYKYKTNTSKKIEKEVINNLKKSGIIAEKWDS